MGKRKSKARVIKVARCVLRLAQQSLTRSPCGSASVAKVFDCPFCNHSKAVECSMCGPRTALRGALRLTDRAARVVTRQRQCEASWSAVFAA
jgi:hypothetical protein